MSKAKFVALTITIPPALLFFIFIANMVAIIFTGNAFMPLNQCVALIVVMVAWIVIWWLLFRIADFFNGG